ncbi:MAG: hydrogenase 4 subunit F [Rikenellaceae bacterium]|jgi:hydrogenase-4 component F|nr:hydrogenase 4 subunit F [Rikenellaceae bacterium]
MTLAYLLILLALLTAVACSPDRQRVTAFSALFYGVQLLFALWAITEARGTDALIYFTFDHLGTLFHLLTAIIAPVVFYQSLKYLDTESVREFRLYNLALILLCVTVTGVYYANNAAMTWIFLEATTLATAMLVYHRRTVRSLEATWKYVFVSSVGIAVAYLGILMLSTAVTGQQGLSYSHLRWAVASANPLYMKMAFLLILTGYSCKMEVFPLYTVGVDANYAAPTPASALISTALVNAGFVSFFRVYQVMEASEIYAWAKSVLLITGILSVAIGAIYLRRTNNFKRFLTYSTVENLGIVLIGLGLGGWGVFAALFHLLVHSLLKSGLFMQMAQVGRFFGTYRMNRLGGYLALYPLGGGVILMGLIGLLAFPPSGLFVSELIVMGGLVAGGHWVVLTLFVLLVVVILYTLCRRFLGLLFRPTALREVNVFRTDRVATGLQFGLIGCALVLGIVQPRGIVEFIHAILAGL